MSVVDGEGFGGEVVAADQFERIAGIEPHGVRLDFDARIQRAQTVAGECGFRPADAGLVLDEAGNKAGDFTVEYESFDDATAAFDGANVALLVALRRPDLARRVVFVSGVFHRDGWLPDAIDPDASPPEVLARGYAELSPDGAGHFPVVSAKLARMNWEEPTLTATDLSAVTSRTLVMTGDDDEVTLEHAIAMYRALPDGELAVVPGTSHGLLHEKPALCNRIIVDFLTTDPVTTIAPVRRADRSA